MEMSEAIVDKRATMGRRVFTWKTIVFGFARSRRRNLRRELDAEVIFLDWHHPWLFFLAVGTMIMSCLDAFMTLQGRGKSGHGRYSRSGYDHICGQQNAHDGHQHSDSRLPRQITIPESVPHRAIPDRLLQPLRLSHLLRVCVSDPRYVGAIPFPTSVA